MTQITKFETGATTHAVNDLILFADNTRELADKRDSIYLQWCINGGAKCKKTDDIIFASLFNKAVSMYKR